MHFPSAKSHSLSVRSAAPEMQWPFPTAATASTAARWPSSTARHSPVEGSHRRSVRSPEAETTFSPAEVASA